MVIQIASSCRGSIKSDPGGTCTLRSQVIAASNRKLEEALESGQFRSDLYYRLSVFPISVPPLRERREDVPLLARHFLKKKNASLGEKVDQISEAAMDVLVAYDWPGNVRELENFVERAGILSPGRTLQISTVATSTGDQPFIGVPVPVVSTGGGNSPPPPPSATAIETPTARGASSDAAEVLLAPERLADVERQHILGVLQACEWKVKGKGNAAERLDLNPSTLRSRMKKLEIRRPGGSDGGAG